MRLPADIQADLQWPEIIGTVVFIGYAAAFLAGIVGLVYLLVMLAF